MVPSSPRPAKDRFSSLDALALSRELRSLDHPRVDKVFDFGSVGWTISFRTRGEGRRDLVIVPGRFAALSTESLEHADRPEAFARELRRLLAGAVLTGVPDPAGERSLAAEFSRTDGTSSIRLYAELFGTGNLLLERDGKLVAVAHPKTWAHRTLRIGAAFVPPPGRTDPWALSAGQIEVLLLGSTADRASTLAARGGFGGPVSEELLIRAAIPGNLPAPEEAGPVAAAIHRAARGLLEEIGTVPAGYLYLEGGQPIDVTPYASARRRSESGVTEERRPNFGPAVLEYFARRPPEAPKTPPTPSVREGLHRQRAKQVEAVERLTAEAGLRTAQANRIFERYQEAEEARAKASEDPQARGAVEVPLGDLQVPLERGVPLERSARTLYEEAKRAKSKLAGAREALAATDARLSDSPPEAAAAPALPTTPTRARTAFWFERFRWFVSSEGILILGGRDAQSNDQVVKRYLRPGDRYVHADLHGAASVVVKRSGTPKAPEPGEATLREAGQWAVSFSKAWRAGRASADAFWVLADQVSKSPASGEFVARGSWVIHGTKHAMKDLPLELALGTVDYEGVSLWTAAPVSAFRDRATIRAFLTPGEERDRAEIEVALSRELGISRSTLQSLLPAGGLALRRA